MAVPADVDYDSLSDTSDTSSDLSSSEAGAEAGAEVDRKPSAAPRLLHRSLPGFSGRVRELLKAGAQARGGQPVRVSKDAEQLAAGAVELLLARLTEGAEAAAKQKKKGRVDYSHVAAQCSSEGNYFLSQVFTTPQP
eukprot:TRINITY_DN6136_c0_g1_i1.p2 TRINITY_DN6136_c0_g1~~TRINITY_DN6136_c0_g1_i1.p2  ORF type:complete len:159 (+),score=74.44 TRINITY_DN6136_c0_g1_i1:68-478(+)